MTTLYVVTLITAGFFLLWIAGRVWRSKAPVRCGIAVLLGLAGLRTLSDATSILLPLSPSKLFFAHLTYILERLQVYAWLTFVAHYTGFMHGRWRGLLWRIIAVACIGVVVFFGMLINFAPTILTFSLVRQDAYWLYMPQLAAPWNALLELWESLLFLGGVVWLVRFIWHRRRRMRDVLIVFVLLALPWFVVELWQSNILPTGYIRPTALAGVVSVVGLAFYLSRTHLLRAQYISLEHVSHYLNDVILVIDDTGIIQEHNAAARAFLGVADAVGKPLATLAPELAQIWRSSPHEVHTLFHNGRIYDVRAIRLEHWLSPLWVLTLEDVTSHVLAQRRVEAVARLLTLLVERRPTDAFYDALAQEVRRAIALHPVTCVVLEVDEQSAQMIVRAVATDEGMQDVWPRIFHAIDDISFWQHLLHLGAPFPITDVSLSQEAWGHTVHELGFRVAWLVPVQEENVVLALFSRTQDLASDDIRFAQEMGNVMQVWGRHRKVQQALARSREIAALAGLAGVEFLREHTVQWQENVQALLTHIQNQGGFACVYLLAIEEEQKPFPRGRLVAKVSRFSSSLQKQAPLAQYGLTETVLEQLKKGESVVFTKTATAPPEAMMLLSRTGARMMCMVPLFVRGRLWGVLGVLEQRAERLLPEEEYALNTTAALIGAAIERSEDEVARQRQMRTLELLNTITLETLRAPTFEEMLDRLAETVGVLFEADGAFVTLWDDVEHVPLPGAAYGPYKESYRQVRALPGEPTITEAVLEAGKPLVIEDAFHSPLVSQRIAQKFPTQTLLALPMIVEGQKIGALLISYHRKRTVPESYILLGQQVASQIALAVKHRRLQEELATRFKETDLLRQAAAMLTASLDFETTVQRVLESIHAFVPYHSATVQLLRQEQGQQYFEIVGGRGWSDDTLVKGIRFLVPGPNPNTLVWRRKQPVRIDDVLSAGYFMPTFESYAIRSWLGVPLLFEDRLMGMIALDHKEIGFFTAEHERLAFLFAQHAAIALRNAHLHETQQKRTRELEALHRATRLLLHSLDVRQVAETFLDICLEAIPTAEKGALMLLDDDRTALRMLASRGYRDERVATLVLPLDAPSYAARALREKRGLVVEDVWADYRIRYRGHIREVGEIRSAVVVPLVSGNEIFGVFSLDATRPYAFTEDDLRLLETFGATAGLVLHNARLHEQIEHASRIDPLTGLYNRRGFFYLADHLLGRTDRMPDDAAVLLFDIDHFKQVNDTFGHDVGDEVLRELAQRTQTLLRERDVVARYGGEEFVILLTSVSPEIAKRVAERLRHRIGSAPFTTSAGSLPITISVGLAMKPAHGEPVSLTQLITWADEALYAAKRAGRNCTFMTDEITNDEVHVRQVVLELPF
ncbi:MAG: diguanylate cyclase [Ardenticatenia bacterium]|nr:MAG: diguanylate cyclase [Ardenticatenia bacterium]